MTKMIKKIFDLNQQLLSLSDKTSTYLRLQNFYTALGFATRTIDTVMVVIDDIIAQQFYFNENSIIVDSNYINQMLGGLLEAQENGDYILLADLFEMQLIPFFLSLQENIIKREKIEVNSEQYEQNLKSIQIKDTELSEKLCRMNPLKLLEENYCVEYTACGLMTLALYDQGKKYYMHSNGQVLQEAGILAREWFSDDNSEYVIYGLGLGYHIMELMQLDENIVINVFESDLNIISLACAFSDLSKILSCDRVHIVYDPTFSQLIASIRTLNHDMRFVIHYPSLRNIKDIKVREQMEDYFVSYSSVNSQLHKLNGNFRKNILQSDAYIDVLKGQFAGKDLYIIAAGPSLEKNYMELKNIGENAIILSTGTVLKKILNAGIIPNYVIIVDANDSVYPQIEGVKGVDIPLLYLSTVYYKVPERYPGKKYLICQEGYKQAEKYADKMGYMLYQTGGSVSTTALDIGIRFGCKRIIYVGLDLAYTNNYDHASGTASVNEVVLTDFRLVKDINGNMVKTSKNLDIYRKWIQRRIDNVKGIEFIDATEGGAKIVGMKIAKLKDVIY